MLQWLALSIVLRIIGPQAGRAKFDGVMIWIAEIEAGHVFRPVDPALGRDICIFETRLPGVNVGAINGETEVLVALTAMRRDCSDRHAAWTERSTDLEQQQCASSGHGKGAYPVIAQHWLKSEECLVETLGCVEVGDIQTSF